MRRCLFRSAVLATAAVAVFSSGALARSGSGREKPNWYATISGYVPFLQDIELKEHSGSNTLQAPEFEFDVGFGLGGAVGYRVSPYFRTELELAWRDNEFDNIGGFTPLDIDDSKYYSQQSIALMANAYLQYPNQTLFTPYVGAGIGAVYVKSPLKEYDVIIQQVLTGQEIEGRRSEEWTLGYQFMAGVSYEVPNLQVAGGSEIVLGYRYLTGEEA
jgi:opacity protein-like surface antigen